MAIAIAEQVVDFLTRGEVRAAVNVPNLSAERLAVLRPFLVLAEKVGALHAQMVSGAPLEVDIEGSGDVADHDMKAVTAAVLKGLLSPVMASGVNYVNAPFIARDRGIRVVESRSSVPSDFLNSIDRAREAGRGHDYRRRSRVRQEDATDRAHQQVLHGGGARGAHPHPQQP